MGTERSKGGQLGDAVGVQAGDQGCGVSSGHGENEQMWETC